MSKKLRYNNFKRKIDLNRLYEAIEFEPTSTRGDWDNGFCIFPDNHAHGDTTGKFGINRVELIYQCWVCGGGDLLSLAMEYLKNDNVDEVAAWLYQFASEPSEDRFLDEFEKDLFDVQERTKSLPYFNERVLDRWTNLSSTAIDFLYQKWGITRETAEDHRVGFDENHSRTVKAETYIGPALIFPVFWKDRLVGWQERWIERDEDRPKWVPKYTNTTDLPRNELIYAYDEALKGGTTLVVESVPSALAIMSEGLNAVATFGASTTDAQYRLLRRFGRVFLVPDNDPAGIKWRDSLAQYLQDFTEVVMLPPPPVNEKGDIADMIAAQDREGFNRWLTQGFDPLDEALADL